MGLELFSDRQLERISLGMLIVILILTSPFWIVFWLLGAIGQWIINIFPRDNPQYKEDYEIHI